MLGKDKPIERFRKAKEEGLIRHKCFSCHDTPENMMKLIDTGEFEGMLCQYNLLDRRNEEAIAHAHEKGLGVAIMGPVGGGRLVDPSERIQEIVRRSQKHTGSCTPFRSFQSQCHSGTIWYEQHNYG